jgi:Tfp pilus assembly protein PilF
MKANQENLQRVMLYWERSELDKAMDLLKKEMQRSPDDPRCISLAAHIYEKAGNTPVAYNLFKQATVLQPTEASHWLNYGRCAQDLWRSQEAERAYTRALSQTTRDSTRVFIYGNLGTMFIDNGDYKGAEKWVNAALKIDPQSKGALSNKGFIQLANSEWAEGWKNYGNNIGTDARRRIEYCKEDMWDGRDCDTLVLYGEQGLGDEICFASMIEDVSKKCRKLIIDCDHRLENLYKRSFPMATIYGTRHVKSNLAWKEDDQAVDYSLPIGQAAQFVRTDVKDCPQTPYLFADPERVAMWKALWKTKGKPVIGIAWSGGIYRTASDTRLAPLSEWGDLLSIDAHFVSLQYKGDDKHPKVHEYPYATRTKDYDDTAALVASLDMVVAVPTTVVHLAGALGTKVIAMHGPHDCWKYHCGIPFHPATHVSWQGSWRETIGAAAKLITGEIERKAA